MLTGSAPRLARSSLGPTPTNRGLAVPPQAAGVPSHPRGLQALARLLAGDASSLPSMTGLTSRRFLLIGQSDLFEAWVIGWPPEGEIDLHDHGGCAGALAVVSGTLSETPVVRGPAGTVTTATRTIPEGSSLGFGMSHVHAIVNPAHETAVSIHVYSPRLTRMTRYRIDAESLRTQETIRCDLGEAIP